MNSLGDRMKTYEFESAQNSHLKPRSWAVLRLDGKAFHTYTKNLEKPFDYDLMDAMHWTMNYVINEISGAVFGYTQSDEISIVFTDLLTEKDQFWFGGKIQKIVSVAASLAGARFNQLHTSNSNLAIFDARVSTLPNDAEVMNYLIWRQLDWQRNALFMAASEFYSHKELMGKNRDEKIAMLQRAGSPWYRYLKSIRYGVQTKKVYKTETVSYARKDTGEVLSTEATRSYWKITAAVDFQGVKLCDLLS